MENKLNKINTLKGTSKTKEDLKKEIVREIQEKYAGLSIEYKMLKCIEKAEQIFLKMIDEIFCDERFKIYCNFETWLRKDIEELKSQINNKKEKKDE